MTAMRLCNSNGLFAQEHAAERGHLGLKILGQEASDNIVNLIVKKKKKNGKATVKIKVTQDGKPVANKKVYGIGGALAFQGIINMIAFSGEQVVEY